MMPDDRELLGKYARERSESAFAELVERRIALVHSAALREARGDASLAQDITQAVFIELAKKAAALCHHPALSGWLYTCARHVAANLRRAEERRQRREQETMNELSSPEPPDDLWRQAQPTLDDAMHDLAEKDRTAIVLRFFDGLSLEEVGSALGLNENAARMRVDRAMERLRGALAKRGITSTASGLAAGLTAGAVVSAPAGLSASVTAGAIASGLSSTSTALSAFQLILTMTKLKICAAVAVIAAAISVPLWQRTQMNQMAAENAALRSQTAELAALRQEAARAQPPQTAAAELEQLRQSNAEMQLELARLRSQVGFGKKAEAENTQLRAEAGRSAPMEAAFTNAMARGLNFAKEFREREVGETVAKMKARLNLTPQQETAIREAYLADLAAKMDATYKSFANRGSGETPNIAAAQGDVEAQIQGLLTPEQALAYPEFKREEKAAKAREAAASDLSQLEKALPLTPEQKERAVAALQGLSLNNANSHPFPTPQSMAGNPAAGVELQIELMARQMEEKIRVLEGILSPEQLASYRKSQESRIQGLKDSIPLLNAMTPRKN